MGEQNKILIIDDDETSLIYLLMFLAENDFYIISAKNIKKGIRKTISGNPCFIILGMSGNRISF